MAKQAEAVVIVAPDQSADRTQQINSIYAKYDPVSKRIPLSQIRANYNRHVRVKTGANAYGVVFHKDAYDIPAMKSDIVAAECVREPLLVAERPDNTFEVLRGFRRFTAVTEIHAEGKELPTIEGTRELPCLVIKGLTEQEEGVFINDQTAKQFNSLEILLEIWRRLKNGQAWYDICISMTDQIASITGSYAKANQVKAAKNREEAVKLIKLWLNNFVNQFYQGILLYGGPLVQKWLVMSYRDDSGLTMEGDEKAPFKVTSTNWPKLYKAIQTDIKNGAVTQEEVNAGKYGPEFTALVAKFSAPPAPTTPTIETKSGEEITKLASMPGRSAPLKDAIMACLKNESRDLVSWDNLINAYLAKRQVWEDTKGMMPESARELLALTFKPDVSVDDFGKQIAPLIEAETVRKEQVKTDAALMANQLQRLTEQETVIQTLKAENEEYRKQLETAKPKNRTRT